MGCRHHGATKYPPAARVNSAKGQDIGSNLDFSFTG